MRAEEAGHQQRLDSNTLNVTIGLLSAFTIQTDQN